MSKFGIHFTLGFFIILLVGYVLGKMYPNVFSSITSKLKL